MSWSRIKKCLCLYENLKATVLFWFITCKSWIYNPIFFFNIIFEDYYYFEVVLVQCQSYKIKTTKLSPCFTWLGKILFILRSLNNVILFFFLGVLVSLHRKPQNRSKSIEAPNIDLGDARCGHGELNKDALQQARTSWEVDGNFTKFPFFKIIT